MNNPAPVPALAPPARLVLERELSMVRGAIDLVAAGISNRVTCAGLRYASQMQAQVEASARRAGVRLTLLWTLDDQATGLTVERTDDA
jgi:hypothetical protein